MIQSMAVVWNVAEGEAGCSHRGGETHPRERGAELTTKAACALLDEVAGLGTPPPRLIITGGDPTSRRDLKELIAQAARAGIEVELCAPGATLLASDTIGELSAAGLKAIALGVDGAEAAIHDAMRDGAGSFRGTMKAWEAARKCGLAVRVKTTVASLNLMELARIAHEVREREAASWTIFPIASKESGGRLEGISAQACEDLMNFIYDVGSAVSVSTSETHHLTRVSLERAVLERRGIPYVRVMPLGAAYHALRAGLEPWAAENRARGKQIDADISRRFLFISASGVVREGGWALAPGAEREILAERYPGSRLIKDLREPVVFAARCAMCEYLPIYSDAGESSAQTSERASAAGSEESCGFVPANFPFQEEIELAPADAEVTRSAAGGGRNLLRH
jgi:MoaA/NifB/PqqE/SkfB family radical SAM enzyme